MPRDIPSRVRPTATEAGATLADLDAVGRRSRRTLLAGVSRLPLVAWGLAWAVGYPLLDQLRWAVAVPVGVILALGALIATWRFGTPGLRTGWETRSRAGWLVVMASSPFLVAVVTPLPREVIALFLGAVWGVGLLLFAVAISDQALGVVGAVVVLSAGASRFVAPGHPLLVFGLVAGVAMLTLGGWRIGRAR